jgi:hypothetical protein
MCILCVPADQLPCPECHWPSCGDGGRGQAHSCGVLGGWNHGQLSKLRNDTCPFSGCIWYVCMCVSACFVVGVDVFSVCVCVCGWRGHGSDVEEDWV